MKQTYCLSAKMSPGTHSFVESCVNSSSQIQNLKLENREIIVKNRLNVKDSWSNQEVVYASIWMPIEKGE